MQKLTYPVLQISRHYIGCFNKWQQLLIHPKSWLENGWWDDTTLIDSTGAKFEVLSISPGRISYSLPDLLDFTPDRRILADLELKKIATLNKPGVRQCVLDKLNAHPDWVTSIDEKIEDIDRAMLAAATVAECIDLIDGYGDPV